MQRKMGHHPGMLILLDYSPFNGFYLQMSMGEMNTNSVASVGKLLYRSCQATVRRTCWEIRELYDQSAHGFDMLIFTHWNAIAHGWL